MQAHCSAGGAGGHIINFSSMGGLATVSGVTLYAASKFAVRGFSLAASKDLSCGPRAQQVAVSVFMPDAVQTPMVDLQLEHDDGAMAFSGDILSLSQVERCILHEVLPNRPVETWLSSRARLARFGDIFGSSRAVALAEWSMKRAGRARQRQIKTQMKVGRGGGSAGQSVLPDQTIPKRGLMAGLLSACTGLAMLVVVLQLVTVLSYDPPNLES